MEARAVLSEIDRRLFLNRKLEMPALGIEQEWIWEMRDRLCAVLAHVNNWHYHERLKKKRRKT